MNGSRIGVSWVVLFATCLGLGSAHPASAQVPDIGTKPDADQSVVAVAVQPDGKLLVAGKFSQIAAQPYQRIARLLVNGKVDAGFAPIVVDGDVNAVAVRRDGKILIAESHARRRVGAQSRGPVEF